MNYPGPEAFVIDTQPGEAQGQTPGYVGPQGLDYLAAVDQLLVKQHVEMLEAFTGWESKNKYRIFNSLGQDVFYAKEENDCCTRMCCGPGRPFEMDIVDNLGREVIHLVRPLRCQGCCFPCCLQELEIQSPVGHPVAYLEQQWTFCTPKFLVKDERGEAVLAIEGPTCVCECCSDIDFSITSLVNNSEIGKITKQWSGFGREMFTDSDNFGVNFPIDLDVKIKAALLGATFLIDFMYFEKNSNN